MNRREFCKLGAGSVTSGLGLLALGHAARAARSEAPAPAGCDPDRMAKRAVQVFLPEKKTCGEAVLVAGCEALGIRSDLVPDIALGLSGGIACRGDVCGMVTGASMVISLAAGKKASEYVKKRKIAWDVGAKFYQDFARKFGTVKCREICGLDLTTDEGMAKLKAGVKRDKCGKVVDTAARMMAERLQEIEKMA